MLKREFDIPDPAMHASVFGYRPDRFDCLICDESHRMMQKVWAGRDDRDFLKAFFDSCRVSVLFYDRKQHVSVNDFVTKEKVLEKAEEMGIPVETRQLAYQHRCRAGDRFLNAVDDLLDNKAPEIKKKFCEKDDYSVALVNDPATLFRVLREKNENRSGGHTSRVLAGKGAGWNWPLDPIPTISLRNSGKKYAWNRGVRYYDGDPARKHLAFVFDEDSVDLVGCIDTSQGLDLEYVGVIIAPDLVYNTETERIEVRGEGHLVGDPNIYGIRKSRTLPPQAELDEIIRNTYRVLLSRGERGCYIFCCDEALQKHLARFIEEKKE